MLDLTAAFAHQDGLGNDIFPGNVGIGAASLKPAAKLEVDGTIYIKSGTGNIGIGSVTPRGSIDVEGAIYGQSMMLSSGNTVNAIVTTISTPTDLQVPTAKAVSSYVATQVSSGTMITQQDTTVVVTDSGANGQVAFKINGSTSVIIDQNGNVGIGTSTSAGGLIVMNGNVGIGSTAPTAALDVNGGIVSSGASDSYLSGKFGVGSSTAIGAGNILGVQGAMTIGSSTYFTTSAPANGLLVSGNVGIGTVTPQGALDVDGTIYGLSMMLSSGNTVNSIVTTISSPTDQQIPTAKAVSAYLISASNTIIKDSTTSVSVLNGGANPIAFTVNGSNSMVVDQNGNVGVGSTAPRSTMDVNGTTSTQTIVLVPPAAGTQSITAVGGVSSVTSSFIRIVGSGGPVTVTANPQIKTAGIADGQELIIIGTNDTNTVKFTSGNGLILLGNVSFTMGNGAKSRFIYSATDSAWVEISRG